MGRSIGQWHCNLHTLLEDAEVELETGAVLVLPLMELMQVQNVELAIGNAESFARRVLVGHAQLMIVKTLVVLIVTTSVIEVGMRLLVHPINVRIEECILLLQRRYLMLKTILTGGKD